MHYVIQLNLGSEAQEQIRSLSHSLAELGISPRELASHGTPHVTVMSSATFPLAKVTKDLASLAREVGVFEITFSHIGIFPGRPVVLFLGVTHTATLTSLHRRLYELVSPVAEVLDFARPDACVFHCSVGYVLQPHDLARAVEWVLATSLPRRVQVRRLDVIECGELSSKTLATYGFSQEQSA